MKDQCCWKCIHAEWQRSPSGRRLSSRFGQCKYEVPWPELPSSYGSQPILPSPGVICDGSGGTCPCFEPIKTPKRKGAGTGPLPPEGKL